DHRGNAEQAAAIGSHGLVEHPADLGIHGGAGGADHREQPEARLRFEPRELLDDALDSANRGRQPPHEDAEIPQLPEQEPLVLIEYLQRNLRHYGTLARPTTGRPGVSAMVWPGGGGVHLLGGRKKPYVCLLDHPTSRSNTLANAVIPTLACTQSKRSLGAW